MKNKYTHISAEQFWEQCKLPDIVLLDVRTSAEFATFHLPDALNIDIKQADFLETVAAELDPAKTYLVYCSMGLRSANACIAMSQLGFTKLLNLKGGLSVLYPHLST